MARDEWEQRYAAWKLQSTQRRFEEQMLLLGRSLDEMQVALVDVSKMLEDWRDEDARRADDAD